MAADLRIRGSFASTSVLLFEDHLVHLEHSHTSDRVRRIRYDRVESIAYWRVLPLGRMVLMGLIFGVPGLGMSFASDEALRVVGYILLAITLIIEARYIYLKTSHIQIKRANKDFKIKGIVSPGKVRRLVEELESSIRRVQESQQTQVTDENGGAVEVGTLEQPQRISPEVVDDND